MQVPLEPGDLTLCMTVQLLWVSVSRATGHDLVVLSLVSEKKKYCGKKS